MPKQKDLKRLIRSRMEKTGEAYTAARLQVLRKSEPRSNYARVAGMSDGSVSAKTGRSWAQWVRVLDDAGSASKPHREIVSYVSSLGTPSWWTQMVTVGYERIRGLREKGQRRGGGYEATKSRTFNVSLEELFDAFENARRRRQWLPAKVAVRSVSPGKRIRWNWEDGRIVVFEFTRKGERKSGVAVGHLNLPDKPASEAMKKMWSGHFDRLAEYLS